MADNYLEFSATIDHLNDTEAAWLDDQLRSIAVIDGTAHRLDSVPDDLDAAKATYLGPKFLRTPNQVDVWGDEPDFSYSFQTDARHPRRERSLWIYAEQYGSVEQAAILVQKFLRAFRPDGIWTLCYAATCSKPRVGEFGGGVVIVTAKNIRWHDSGAIAARAVKAHERRKQCLAA